jgi:hypothetical protein
MATLTVTLTNVCSGGNHLTFTVSGDASATVQGEVADLSAPITEADKQAFVKVISKMSKSGKTLAAAKTQLQTGVTVTV